MGADEAQGRRRPVRVILPRNLISLFPGATGEVEIEAANVAAAIAELDARWPGMAERLRDSRPAIRRHINIFIEGRRAGLETPLAGGEEVVILPAISGG